MPSSTAASVFASISEVLLLLVEHFHRDTTLLARLCRVNRRFNATFGPVLYRECDIRTAGRLSGLRRCSHLAHTKRFSLGLPSYGNCNFDLNDVTSAPELIKKMSALEVFEWAGQPLSPDVPQALKSCGSLKSVHITYPERIERAFFELDEWDGDIDEQGQKPGIDKYSSENARKYRRLFYAQDLSTLAGLESLLLDNIYGDMHLWQRHLAQILRNCPDLHTLGLSIASQAIVRCGRSTTAPWEMWNFFNRVCDAYGLSPGGSTLATSLQLRSLMFGKGVYATERNSIVKLTNLSLLEEVEFDNETIWNSAADIEYHVIGNDFPIIYDVFLSPDACPNMRRFHINYIIGSTIAEGLMSLKENNPGFLRRLVIEVEAMHWYDYLENLALPGTSEESPTGWVRTGTLQRLCSMDISSEG